tara:strand:- start:1948 stop:4413 length:2466 start_codon:yes stop_codon:yes gene_type:complete
MPNLQLTPLIDQLKLVALDNDYEKHFSLLTANLDGPSKFKVRAEVRRLTSPCARTLDLRKRVDGDCKRFDHRGRTHFLDEVARDIFERGLKQYNGVFTQDTYERIMQAENNYRVMYEHQKLAELEKNTDENVDSKNFRFELFKLGFYPYRDEERMNYTVEVVVEPDGGQPFRAVTNNISQGGLRVRVDRTQLSFASEQRVRVYFTGFAKEFTLDPNKPIDYVITNVKAANKRSYISLKRANENDNPEFDAFISRFISGYKRRYKINTDNTEIALINKAHEQFYLPRMTRLTLFLKAHTRELNCKYVLTTDNNEDALAHWYTETNELAIGSLLNKRRSQFMINRLKRNEPCELTILTFSISAKGKIHFYSALAEELEKTRLWDTFTAFAVKKSSFQAFRISLSPVDHAHAWRPQAVPQHINLPAREQPFSQDIQAALAEVDYLATLDNVTDLVKPLCAVNYNKEELAKLRAFVHPPSLPQRSQAVKLEFVDLRSEQRYQLRSRCRVKSGSIVRDGMVLDISNHGLRIQVDEPIPGDTRSEMRVTFSQLKQRYKNEPLADVNYQIVNSDEANTTFNLKLTEQSANQAPGQFLTRFIKEKRSQLPRIYENKSLKGFELGLRNLYCDAASAVPLFFYRSKRHEQYLGRVGIPQQVTDWSQLLQMPSRKISQSRLTSLLNEGTLFDYWTSWLTKADRKDAPLTTLLIFQLGWNEKSQRTINLTSFDTQTLSLDDVEHCVTQALLDGTIIAVNVELSRTGRPDSQFVEAEMQYLSAYAQHKVDRVEEQLESVIGVADSYSVSNLLMQSLQLSDSLRATAYERLRQWL